MEENKNLYYFKDDFDKTLEANQGLINKMCNKHLNVLSVNKTLDFDDLISISQFALYKAFKNYDENKSLWSTYAANLIENDLRLEHRKMKTQSRKIEKETVYIQNKVEQDKSNNDKKEISFDQILGGYQFEDYFILVDFLKSEIKEKLTEKEYIALIMNSKDIDQRIIAERLNVSQPHVSRLIKKAIKKFKELYSSL